MYTRPNFWNDCSEYFEYYYVYSIELFQESFVNKCKGFEQFIYLNTFIIILVQITKGPL